MYKIYFTILDPKSTREIAAEAPGIIPPINPNNGLERIF
jgi:hypothetical protein